MKDYDEEEKCYPSVLSYNFDPQFTVHTLLSRSSQQTYVRERCFCIDILTVVIEILVLFFTTCIGMIFDADNR